MAIEGPLHELAASDLLQLLELTRKTGTLVLRPPGGSTAWIHLEEGMVTGAGGAVGTPPIGELLLRAGAATGEQIAAGLRRQRERPRRRLGALLAEDGVPRQEVERQLRAQVESVVQYAVGWTEGRFRFETGPAPAAEIALRIPVGALLLEAARRSDELLRTPQSWLNEAAP